MDEQANREAALGYAARGWRVFPLHNMMGPLCSCRTACSSPGKHPRTPNGLHDATTDPAQIERWWKMWPGANVGVATGPESGLLVLDVDNARSVDIGGGVLVSEGLDSLAKLEEAYGALPDTLAQETGSGGRHYLFRYPVDGREYRNRTSFVPSLDVRGDGGYIVVPPSNHRSANPYRWLSQADLESAPGWLLDLIASPASSQLVERPEGKIGEGGRNSWLTQVAGKLRGEKCLDAIDLFGALMARNQEWVDPPLPVEEVRHIANQAARWECNEEQPIWALPPEAVRKEEIPEIEEGADTVPTLAEFLSITLPTPTPLVEGLIDGGTGVIVGGRPNVGKSWLVFDLAIAVAFGLPFLDKFPTQRAGVLVLDEEGSAWGDQRRLRMLLAGRELDHREDGNLRLAVGRGIKLDEPKGLTTVRRMLERYRPELVIYDSLVRAHNGDENASREMASFFRIAKQLMQSYGVAFLFTHHVRKPTLLDAGNPADWLRGSSEITAWPETAFVIEPGSDSTELKVEHAKSRDHRRHAPFTVRLLVDEINEMASLSWLQDVDRTDRTAGAAQSAVEASVRSIVLLGDEATVARVASEVRKSPETVRQYLNVLVESGKLVKAPGRPGKQTSYMPVDT